MLPVFMSYTIYLLQYFSSLRIAVMDRCIFKWNQCFKQLPQFSLINVVENGN